MLEKNLEQLFTDLANTALIKRDVDTQNLILRAFQQADLDTVLAYTPVEGLKNILKLFILAIKALYYQNIELEKRIEKLEKEV